MPQRPSDSRFGDACLRLRFRVQQSVTRARGRLRGNGIQAFWYTGRVNFGDLLTRELLNSFGFTTSYAPLQDSTVVCVGSVLQVLPEHYSGTILGSGLIAAKARHFPNARILGVRGALTRELIGAPRSTTLGDPGLLAGRLLPCRPSKTFRVGIVPHYEDKGNQTVRLWSQKFGSDTFVIDVERGPREVLLDIASCSLILSSSLHGIICADALGIPNAWVEFSDRVVGDGFKFADYGTSISRPLERHRPTGEESLEELIAWMDAPSGAVSDVAANLESTFLAFRDSFT